MQAGLGPVQTAPLPPVPARVQPVRCIQSARPAIRQGACVQQRLEQSSILHALAAPSSARPQETKPQQSSPAPDGQALVQYVYWTSQRQRVVASVQQQSGAYQITISLPRQQQPLELCWGLCRASFARWHVPKDVAHEGDQPDKQTGGSASQLLPGKTWRLSLPSRLAPVTLVFRLRGSKQEEELHNARGALFAVPVGMVPGQASMLGPALMEASEDGKTCAINFAVRSRFATSMSLVLARQQSGSQQAPGKGYLELALDPDINRTGDVWHLCLPGLRDAAQLCFGWRADSASCTEFVPGQVMLDPYAPLVASMALPEGVHLVSRAGKAASKPQNAPALLGSLAYLQEAFEWGSDQLPKTPLVDSIILEVDVPTFSTGDPRVPAEHRGRFLGVGDRLKHLQAMGATAVMLTPAMCCGEGPWGRAPRAFFAPEPAWASGAGPLAPQRELKQLVRDLHAQGIEVILQVLPVPLISLDGLKVEFCFTAEGTEDDGLILSLRGLDAPLYYRAGGVLSCGHAVVRTLVLAALRYWALQYHVDGFCFLNAETLVQDRDGTVLDAPPLPEAIAYDPILGSLKLIARPGDEALLPRGGDRGFPHWSVWAELSPRFPCDLGRALNPFPHAQEDLQGSPTIASAIATRLMGSADLFAARWEEGLPGSLAAGRAPSFGLNTIVQRQQTFHEAVDLLSHPDAPRSEKSALGRTMLTLALLSQGVPTLAQEAVPAGSVARFVGVLVRLRARLAPLLAPAGFSSPRQITWHGAAAGSSPDWDGNALRHQVYGAAYMGCCVTHPDGRAAFLAFNAHGHPVTGYLPSLPQGYEWRRLVDTGLEAPDDAVLDDRGAEVWAQDQYELQGKAAILLLGTQQPQAKQQASAEALADTVAASQSEEPLKPAEPVSGHPAGNGKPHAPYGPIS